MNNDTRIPVLLVDDHVMVREGIRQLLEADKDIKVCGEADNGHQAIMMSKELRPAVVVMDIAMPLLNGLEATRQICREIRNAKVILLSAHSEHAYIERAIALGASGYVDKNISADFLCEAIRKVSEGSTFFRPDTLNRHKMSKQATIDRNGRPAANAINLSSREVEVLQLIAEGNANKQIAAALGISIKTVEKHRAHLMQKLDIHETAGLTRYAVENGIIESGAQPVTA